MTTKRLSYDAQHLLPGNRAEPSKTIFRKIFLKNSLSNSIVVTRWLSQENIFKVVTVLRLNVYVQCELVTVRHALISQEN